MEFISIALVVVAVVFVFKAVIIVPQGYNYTVEHFGRYTKTLSPGLHIIMPLVECIGTRVSMMETVLDVPSQDVITKDNAAVTVDGVIFYQILDAARASYEVAELQHAILNLTMTNIRTVMGSMDLDELLSNRENINARLLIVVDEATGPWGTKLTRVEIKDIRPPQDLVTSMARQMKAERDKRALILEAEGDRAARVLSAEGVRQSMILEAEGRMESAKLDAEARECLGQAEARVTTLISTASQKGGGKALNYFVAQKYVEAFSKLAESPNQKLVLMPMEVSGLVGSLAGLAQLTKDSLTEEEAKPFSTTSKKTTK